ncbi:MAG: methyltransferase [Vicinamibacteraceae bacterium]
MSEPAFAHGSTGRLTAHDLGRFRGETLFDRLGRAVCEAGCLPRKELYEAWEMARRVRRVCRGGRVVDLGGGHGLLAQVMLLLDDTSPSALVVDAVLPASHAVLQAAIAAAWPRLSGRVGFAEQRSEDVALSAEDLVVSCHACGALSDGVLDRAIGARARVAVLPCCHDHARGDAGDLAGWMPADLAIDATRAARLRHEGYRVWTKTIPAEVTPRNRLLIGVPADQGAAAPDATSARRPS